MKRKNLKKLVIILLSMALLLALGACAKEETAAAEPTANQQSPAPTLSPTPTPIPASTTTDESARESYDIALSIDTSKCKISEDITLKVYNYSDDQWDNIVLRDYMAVAGMYGKEAPAADEGISSVTAENGEPLSFAADESDASVVRVSLNAPLMPKESRIIKLSFSATISASGDRCLYSSLSAPYGEPDNGNENARTIELSQCFPIMAIYENGDWVCEPYFMSGECMYSRCADYDIALTLPKGWTVVATGDERQTENGDAVNWQISARNVREIALVASNELAVLTDTTGDITVNSYYCAVGEKMQLQGEQSLKIATNAAAFYEKSFGAYPYGELDVVQSGNNVGGIEAPGIVRIARFFAENIGPDGGDIDHLFDENVAHETAHQWFYAVVGNNQYKEPWLDEGFASAAALFFAKDSGWGQHYVDRWLSIVHQYYDEVAGKQYYVDLPYNELLDDYSGSAYRRAGEFLYRLSESMGEEEFYSFISTYYSDFSFKEATTADFLNELAPYIASNAAAQELVRENLTTPLAIG